MTSNGTRLQWRLNPLHVRFAIAHRTVVASLVITVALACPAITCAQTATPPSAPAASMPAAPNQITWHFGTAPPTTDDRWTAERGRLSQSDGVLMLQPDANRRVTLLSPPGLPDAVRHAEQFVVDINGTGLQRV